jgi:hypothetical protein
MKKKSVDFSLAMERIRDDKCPVCGGDNLMYDNIASGGSQNIECNCGAHWTLFHTLAGFGNLNYEVQVEGTAKCLMEFGEIEIKNNPHLNMIDHWPEILDTIFSQKKILPALLGIDNELDKIIAKRLNG